MAEPTTVDPMKIALTIKNALNKSGGGGLSDNVRREYYQLAAGIAELIHQSNPSFHIDDFLRTCGMNTPEWQKVAAAAA